MAEAHRDEIAKLEALCAANPEGHVFTHLAEAYRKAGELDRAREILDEGLRRHPDSASAHVVLGRVEHDRADQDAARQAFTRALSLDAGNLVALRHLGELALERGDRAEALGRFRELLSRDTGNASVQQTVEELSSSAAAEAATAAGGVPAAGELVPEREEPWSPAEPPEPREDELLPWSTAGETEPTPAEAAVEPEWSEPWAPAEEPPAEPPALELSEPWLEVPADAAGEQWEGREPDHLTVDEPDEAWEPDFLLPVEGQAFEAGTDLEQPEAGYLRVEPEPGAAAGEPEFLSLEVEAAPWDAPEPDFEPPAGEVPPMTAAEPWAGTPDGGAGELGADGAAAESVADQTAADQQAEEFAAPAEAGGVLEPAEAPYGEPVEIPAEPAVSAEEAAPPEPGDSLAEPAEIDSGKPVSAEADEASPAETEVAEPTVTAAEADLVLAAAFEAPAEVLPGLEGVTALGDLPREGPESATAPAEADAQAAPGLFTETMAELYRRQGFADRAAEVYRWLLSRDPGNERLQQLLTEVESEQTGVGRGGPQRAWLEDLQGVESAFTGAAGATPGGASPYDWSAAGEDVGAPGQSIGHYFRQLLAWRPAERAPAVSAPGAGPELLLEEVVGEAPAAAGPEAAGTTEVAAQPEELMPWEFAEPPSLAAEPGAEAGSPLPEARPIGGEPGQQDERQGEVEPEDEDLEMFRSWLQSLKK